MKGYKQRIADRILEKRLKAKGAVLIEGPKWCGKTTTAEQSASSTIMLSRPEVRDSFKSILEIDSSAALSGPTPMLIDEWQTVPKTWDAVRAEIDARHKTGQFILTGSAVPDKDGEKEIFHSGTGRFSWLTMRPMTLFESADSTGAVSLADLFDRKDKLLEKNNLALENIAFLACRGGWPMSLGLPEEAALEQAFDYYDAVTMEDITRVDGVRRASETARRLMRAYARHQGAQVSIDTLREDMSSTDAAPDRDTVSSYLEALRKIFVVEDMPAWNPNLRSKTAIRTSDTRYFVDPSIATAALGLGPGDLMKELNTFGLIFETLCVRDLRVYAQASDGTVSHYRDKSGLECDAVIHLRNGKYGLVEIKLGGETLINHGIETLNALAARIDTSKMQEPSFKMVLTAVGNYAYRRPEDGIYIVPVGTLGA